ncbi:MAG: hypothetical protein ACFFDW_03545 [Candidatus Thorarchaeota archaeon]
MKKLVMLAREITEKEISKGIGTEQSSTRLSPIYKTIDLNVPIKDGIPFDFAIPINPFIGTPLLLMPLLFIPHHESYLYGSLTIVEKIISQYLQPTKVISDPGKGTGSPIIATALESKDDDILILAPCDQYQSEAVKKAVDEILNKIEKEGFACGTVLTTGTQNPAFSYIRVKEDKAVEFMLKGTIPKENMIAETMIVCCKVDYLKEQIAKTKDLKLKELKEIYPYSEEEVIEIQNTLTKINSLMGTCKSAKAYLEKCPFCDFSRIIHKLLIEKMTYATVKYQQEWDDLGDWQKVYNSPIFPKDKNGNLIFSIPDLISYKNCKNSLIANFSQNKIIINGLKNRIFAVGPRGAIDIPLEMDPVEFKKEVISIKM